MSSEEDETSDDGSATEPPSTDTDSAVSWEPCTGGVIAADGSLPECALIKVPLDYSAPDAATIEVLMYRIRATSNERRGQLWFLPGGPGDSGESFADHFDTYRKALPQWDLYSLDHRGVGRSTRLSCDEMENILDNIFAGEEFNDEQCARELVEEWGDDLAYFNTTNAAKDVARLIELTSQPDEEVMVYGLSYGTYWAERLLQVSGGLVDGVILDSLCPPGHCQVDAFDQGFEKNGQKIMERCSQDPTCAARFGELGLDPVLAVSEWFRSIDEGTVCSAISYLDRSRARRSLALLSQDAFWRVWIAPLVYRSFRCNDDDQEFLSATFFLIGRVALPFALGPDARGIDDDHLTLGTYLALSELMGERTYEEVSAFANEAHFSFDVSPKYVALRDAGVFPLYPKDSYAGEAAQSDVPMLMMNGDLDPRSPLDNAKQAAMAHHGPHQTFVTMPWSTDNVLVNSSTADFYPWSDDISDDSYLLRTCGFELMAQFLANPTASLDVSCTLNTRPDKYRNDLWDDH